MPAVEKVKRELGCALQRNALPMIPFIPNLLELVLQLLHLLHFALSGLASCKSVARSFHGDGVVGVLDDDGWERFAAFGGIDARGCRVGAWWRGASGGGATTGV